jgi:chlorobactene glucosyltransferase
VAVFMAALFFTGVVALTLYRLFRQFRLYENLEPLDSSVLRDWPSVAVIVPARNEAVTIARCVGGLLAQIYPPGKVSLLVVDDNSTDGTAEIVRRIAASNSALRLVEAGPLPAGWTGKCHACWRGTLAADAEWLCFVDADTSAEPALLRTAIDAALRRNLQMLSLEPFQELKGLLERLVLPVGFLALGATQDLAETNRSSDAAAAVNGQFILIRSDSYHALGGHSAVRQSLTEDGALARRAKAQGINLAVLGAESLIRTRMYRDAAGLWQGLAKNVTETFGGPRRTAVIAAAGLVLGWATLLLPIAAGMAMLKAPTTLAIISFALAAGGAMALFATGIAVARHFRVPSWYGFLLPLSCTIAAMICFTGILVQARGRIAWKGRIYSPAERNSLSGSRRGRSGRSE